MLGMREIHQAQFAENNFHVQVVVYAAPPNGRAVLLPCISYTFYEG